MSGVKNTCRVLFHEFLDLTPFTTSGQLSTLPSAPISSPFQQLSRGPSTPTLSDPQLLLSRYTPQVLYRLSAAVCHYGTHSFGHYVAYRRKPLPVSAGARRWLPPTLRCSLDCECEKCAAYGPIRDEDEKGKVLGPSSRWLRISDDSVDEVGLERVLAESVGTFMLYYERVIMAAPASSRPPSLSSSATFSPRSETPLTPKPTPSSSRSASQDLMDLDLDADLTSAPWPIRSSPRSSEETIKPVREHHGHGHLFPSPDPSDPDLALIDGRQVSERRQGVERWLEARIVQSVYAGRSARGRFRDLSPGSSCTLESVSVAATSEGGEREAVLEDGTEMEVEVERISTGKKRTGQANGHVDWPHSLSQSMPDLPTHLSLLSSSSSSSSQRSPCPSLSSAPSISASLLPPHHAPRSNPHPEGISQLETQALSEGLTA